MAQTTRALAAVVVVVLGSASGLLAQQQKTMRVVDLIEIPGLSDPQLSPDGRSLLYVRSEADWKANKRIPHVWRADVATGRSLQLTNGEKGESGARWSPDGKWIAFTAKRGEDEEGQIWLLPADGGEAKRLTKHATSPSDLTWAPDGSALYFVADEPKSKEQKEREKLKDDVYGFDENYQQPHLWKVAVPGGEETRITSGDYAVTGYELSRDGRKIVLNRAPNPLLGYADRSEVWVMDADGKNAAQLTKNGQAEGGPQLSPDNAQVLFTCDCNEKFESYYNDKIFVMPAAGGAARVLMPEFPYEVRRAVWSKDGKAIYFVANMGVHSELFRLDPASGKYTQLTNGDHGITGWQLAVGPGMQVFGVDDATSAGDFRVMPAAGGKPTQVTHVYDHYAKDFRLPRQEKVTWKGKDGVTVEGLLFYPLDYQAGQRYPLVVQTHGGPAASDNFGFGRWNDYTQVLTAMGYAVLHPNYRGSTGYGDAFLRDMVGHYWQNAHFDVMAGVDRVIEMGIADPDRLVAMGWSAGGHMTNKLITFTDRFKAASSGAGGANYVSFYAQSDTRHYRTPWFGGTPWQKDAPIEKYIETSPVFDTWKVKTPTIFLVGGSDPRVPMPQSVEMYRGLVANGVPTHLYVAPREPHGWQELRHELFKANVELDWFEKWVRNRTYTWEKAPGGETATTAAQQ
ncbi:MAG TPA: S9 family peptidase [Longimicrobiales bacterium]|nr:S9 family peptidase [Longimicrobiales bacterium]